MLVLTRKKDERINIGSDIQVVVLAVQGNRVRLGLIAPAEMPILREELQSRTEWEIPEEPIGEAARLGESIEALRVCELINSAVEAPQHVAFMYNA